MGSPLFSLQSCSPLSQLAVRDCTLLTFVPSYFSSASHDYLSFVHSHSPTIPSSTQNLGNGWGLPGQDLGELQTHPASLEMQPLLGLVFLFDGAPGQCFRCPLPHGVPCFLKVQDWGFPCPPFPSPVFGHSPWGLGSSVILWLRNFPPYLVYSFPVPYNLFFIASPCFSFSDKYGQQPLTGLDSSHYRLGVKCTYDFGGVGRGGKCSYWFEIIKHLPEMGQMGDWPWFHFKGPSTLLMGRTGFRQRV